MPRFPFRRPDGLESTAPQPRPAEPQTAPVGTADRPARDDLLSRVSEYAPTIRPTMTVSEAVAALRHHPGDAAYGEVYVTSEPSAGAAPVLLGAVSYRALAMSDQHRLIAGVMRPDVVTVGEDVDPEEAARLFRRHRLAALPVTRDGELRGVLTAADVTDILQQEATEDAALQGGTQPLDVPYLKASPLLLWRRRVVWMLLLFAAEMYTGTVLKAFEDELETVIALAFFVPLLIGTGGNAGTQITTTLIRAMATSEVRLRDVVKVVRKETATGLLIGLTIAAAALVRAFTQGVGGEVALTVAVAAGAIVVWSSVVASVLPLLLRRLRIDPAVVSGPMITTLVDGTGLIIYFEIARVFVTAIG